MKWFVVSLFALVLAPLASFAACSDPSGNEGEVIYNSTAKMLQFCNGTVWVNAAGIAPGSGGGGGKPTYAGLSSGTTNGDVTDEVAGLNALCDATYPGSRPLYSSEYKYIASDIVGSSGATEGWFICDDVFYHSSSSWGCSGVGGNNYVGSGGPAYSNCYGWTSTGYNQLTLGGTAVRQRPCGNAYPIHCVTD